MAIADGLQRGGRHLAQRTQNRHQRQHAEQARRRQVRGAVEPVDDAGREGRHQGGDRRTGQRHVAHGRAIDTLELVPVAAPVQRRQRGQQGAHRDLRDHHHPRGETEGEAVEGDLLGRREQPQEEDLRAVAHERLEDGDDGQRGDVAADLGARGRRRRHRGAREDLAGARALHEARHGRAEHEREHETEDVETEGDDHDRGQQVQRHLHRARLRGEVVALGAENGVRVDALDGDGHQHQRQHDERHAQPRLDSGQHDGHDAGDHEDGGHELAAHEEAHEAPRARALAARVGLRRVSHRGQRPAERGDGGQHPQRPEQVRVVAHEARTEAARQHDRHDQPGAEADEGDEAVPRRVAHQRGAHAAVGGLGRHGLGAHAARSGSAWPAGAQTASAPPRAARASPATPAALMVQK